MNGPSTVDDVVELFGGSDESATGLYGALAPVYAFTMDQRDAAGAYHALVRSSVPSETGSVVEFACGHGALLAHLEQSYDEVLGIDLSGPLLAMARSRYDVPVVRADVRRPCLHGPFDAVAMVGRSLAHMLTDEDVRGCFEAAFELLVSGGRFVVDCHDRSMVTDDFSRERAVEDEQYRVQQHTESTIVDRADGILERVDTFTVTVKSTGRSVRVATDPWRIRTFDVDSLVGLLEGAGFSIESLGSAYGGHQVVAER